jgi:two-component system, chemotaxis family, chemotaxis protein CheY
LPVQHLKLARELDKTMPNPSYSHLRALIVEDTESMRKLLRSLLHAVGIKYVIEAVDGEEGYLELCSRTPDLIFTDLSMARADGIAFTRRVRTADDSPNRYVPIVMVTGHTDRQSVETARDAGVTEFLAKPVTASNLVARLAEIVERPRPFVRCESYFGPDRRRRKLKDYAGPWRRDNDFEKVEIA